MNAIMGLFVPCPEKHDSTGRQCEQARGHRNRGLPHVYTASDEFGVDMWPVWWDESGDLKIPLFIRCPLKECPEAELVHPISPDNSIINLMFHFQCSHGDLDMVELLDAIVWDE